MENFNDWQKTASCEVLRSRDSDTAMRVLGRTLETSTRDMRLKPIDLTDPQDVALFSMIAGGQLRKASIGGGETVPDDGKPLGRDEIFALDGEQLQAQVDTRAQAEQLMATLKGDLSSIASITIEPGESAGTNFVVRIPPLVFKTHDAALFTMQLDTRLMFENLPPYAKKEYSELLAVDDYVVTLAYLIQKYIEDDGVDLAVSLVIFHLQNAEQRGAGVQFQDPAMIDRVLSASKEGKEGLLSHFVSEIEVPIDLEEKALRWALGTNFFERLSQGNPDMASKMKALQTLLETREDFRDKLLRAVRRLPAITDKQLASVFVRQGWRTLINIDSVSDDEWWTYLREATQKMLGDPKMQEGVLETDSQRARFQKTIVDVEAYFRENPEPSGVVQKLADEIGCRKLRQELEKLEKEHNPVAVASKQREIMHRVFGAVTRYTHAENDQEKNPSYRAGFPVNVAKNKDTTCFSGPWLMSIMLFLSGIHYEDLLYCHVNETSNGQLGGHGAILMKTRLREVMTIDHGFHFAGREFPYFFVDEKQMAERFVGLLEEKTDQPVRMRFRKSAQLNRAIGYHPDVTVMPLGQGFASGHLLHVGIDFIHSGKLDEAKYALELGISFNQRDPDLWYYLGLAHLQEGDDGEAGNCFNEALKQFDGHLISHFSLGELAMRLGNFEEALRRFTIVGKDKRRVWGDDGFQKRARKYATMSVAELQATWEDGTFATMEGISEAPKAKKDEDVEEEEGEGEADYQI